MNSRQVQRQNERKRLKQNAKAGTLEAYNRLQAQMNQMAGILTRIQMNQEVLMQALIKNNRLTVAQFNEAAENFQKELKKAAVETPEEIKIEK